MAFLAALPEIAEAAGPMLGRLVGSGVGKKVLQTVGTKAVGAVTGGDNNDNKPSPMQSVANLATTAADNFHPVSNSGPVPGSQPMDQPGYNNLSQAQFGDSVQQQ